MRHVALAFAFVLGLAAPARADFIANCVDNDPDSSNAVVFDCGPCLQVTSCVKTYSEGAGLEIRVDNNGSNCPTYSFRFEATGFFDSGNPCVRNQENDTSGTWTIGPGQHHTETVNRLYAPYQSGTCPPEKINGFVAEYWYGTSGPSYACWDQ